MLLRLAMDQMKCLKHAAMSVSEVWIVPMRYAFLQLKT